MKNRRRRESCKAKLAVVIPFPTESSENVAGKSENPLTELRVTIEAARELANRARVRPEERHAMLERLSAAHKDVMHLLVWSTGAATHERTFTYPINALSIALERWRESADVINRLKAAAPGEVVDLAAFRMAFAVARRRVGALKARTKDGK